MHNRKLTPVLTKDYMPEGKALMYQDLNVLSSLIYESAKSKLVPCNFLFEPNHLWK